MRYGKLMAWAAMACYLFALTPSTEAAVKKGSRSTAGGAMSGVVIRGHGKSPVAGALVRMTGTHHARHRRHARVTVKPTTSSNAKPSTVKPKLKARKLRAKARAAVVNAASTMSGADGRFTLAVGGTGTHLLVAHKKHVGSGHARATAGAAVTIRLHKHHHHHTKVTAHKKKKVKAAA